MYCHLLYKAFKCIFSTQFSPNLLSQCLFNEILKRYFWETKPVLLKHFQHCSLTDFTEEVEESP